MSTEGAYVIRVENPKMSREFCARIQDILANTPLCDLCKKEPVAAEFKVIDNRTGAVKKTVDVCMTCLIEVA